MRVRGTTKNDIAQYIAEQTGLRMVKAKVIVQWVLDLMTESIVNEGGLEFRGFGTFVLVMHEARMARNPRTGEKVQVPRRRVVQFKPGTEMAKRVIGEQPKSTILE
jgi:DNA-binding protein HU-beta/integration host factor subunit beta